MRKAMNRQTLAWLLVIVGATGVVSGFALVYAPAAPIVGGLILIALGLFGVEIGGRKK